ncbi:MAG: flagellar protein FlaG [Treponema sp.]|uniref:flagellar protein FlaG n=1 Tax=Treponema sp. TaxID=166 RepID=UPI001DAB83B6|nr:flagellar protein FlaG [Treponema sp.]MBS7309645.1 flagellar protein FlaG [Treponema sp.]MCI5696485.1 flagellar protein FlaG [Spirochaetia bacterium]MDD5810478.1 flagellar protein FlaG [Treponema sp.]
MNTISNIGANLATDGRYYNSSAVKASQNIQAVNQHLNIADGARVVDSLVQNNAQIKADAYELQKLSDMVMGPKLQFNVNEELGSVIVKVVDPTTNQVIKEIPSPDIQRLKMNIRRAIGVLFDEMI